MQPSKEKRILNSIMFGTTTVSFIIWIFITENNFTNSFFENLLVLLLMLIGSFFIGNIIIGIPIAIIYYLTTYKFEDFYEFSKKAQFFIVSTILIIICVIIAFIVT